MFGSTNLSDDSENKDLAPPTVSKTKKRKVSSETENNLPGPSITKTKPKSTSSPKIKLTESVQQVLERDGNDVEEVKKQFKELQQLAMKQLTYALMARMQLLNYVEETVESCWRENHHTLIFSLNMVQLNKNKNIKRKVGRPPKNPTQNQD